MSSPTESRHDVHLHVTRDGTGSPSLVLVHGFTGSVLDWTDVATALSADREVIAFDHRGHGDSTNTSDPTSYTIAALTDDLLRVLDDSGVGAVHLLGHSMGGVVAQRFTLDHPDRVLSLILMDTMAAPSSLIPKEFVDPIVELGRTSGMSAVAEQLVPMAEKMTPPPSAESIDRMRTKLGQMDPEAFGALADQLGSFPAMLDELSAIACPTTIIVGERDTAFRDPSEAMHAAISNSTLVVIADAGHSPQEDQPVAWLAAVTAHLATAGTPT